MRIHQRWLAAYNIIDAQINLLLRRRFCIHESSFSIRRAEPGARYTITLARCALLMVSIRVAGMTIPDSPSNEEKNFDATPEVPAPSPSDRISEGLECSILKSLIRLRFITHHCSTETHYEGSEEADILPRMPRRKKDVLGQTIDGAI